METIRKTYKKPECPNCKSPFKMDYQATVVFSEGGMKNVRPLGYLTELECFKCGTRFPFFRGSASSETFNSIIENNNKLLSANVVGGGGVGLAQQMLSALDSEGTIAYLMGLSQSPTRKRSSH